MNADERLWELLGGFRLAQFLHAAAVLGVCDAIGPGARSADEVASRTGCAPAPVGRLLRALATVGVVRMDASGRFSNTELGELLCEGHPSGLRSGAISRLDDPIWRAWGALTEAVRTDSVAYELANGSSFWEDLAQRPDAAATFNTFMGSRTLGYAESLKEAFHLGPTSEIIDVGGGQGTLVASLLQKLPEARGVLFDQASGLAEAGAYLEKMGVAARVRIVTGDIFFEVPRTDSCLLLRRVLHDWPDADAIKILKRCADALGPDARLLVSEYVLPDVAEPNPEHEAQFTMDLHMFVLFGAQERTAGEFHQLFEASGLQLTEVLATTPEATMILRRRPEGLGTAARSSASPD